MAERKEVRLAGAGTHGMIEAGLILQEAAAIYDDLNAHHVQSYGPEARSNWSRSEVIISEGEIDYPKAIALDAVLFTTEEACERYVGDLKDEALIIVDEVAGEVQVDGKSLVRLPLVKTAEDLGKPNLVHIVALGALVELSGVVSKEAIERAVKDHVPRGGEDVHLEALQSGYRLGGGAKPGS